MAIPNEILAKESDKVASLWRYWSKRMHEEVEFWTIPDTHDVHTESHCERVLLHALKIGEALAVSDRSLIALCHASIFHDSRRKDNYLDVGHGDRAADYYRAFCEASGMEFLPDAFAAIKFHDRDDRLGEDYIMQQVAAESKDSSQPIAAEGKNAENSREEIGRQQVLVYRIFKDADALDRLRLGPWMLNEQFLRTDPARNQIAFAQQLVEATMDPEVYESLKEWTRPFADRMRQKDNGRN